MSKKVLLATEKPFAAPARNEVVGILEQAGYTVVLLESYQGKGPLAEALSDVDAAIVRSDVVDREVLDAASRLKLVVRAGAGYDNIDTAWAKQRGVAVMNTPGQNANAVGELALGLMIYMARARFSGKSGTELRGKRLGLQAFGATAKALSRAGRAIGMTVRAFDPFVPPAAMEEHGVAPVGSVDALWRESDYVSLHMPATSETKRSVGAALLGLLPKGGCVVNTARAELIHEEELLATLAERKDLRYAADVQPSEATQAVIKEKYADRVYFTPKKMGAQTEEANVNAGVAAAHQIVDFFERGDRRFIVNG